MLMTIPMPFLKNPYKIFLKNNTDTITSNIDIIMAILFLNQWFFLQNYDEFPEKKSGFLEV